MELLLTAIHFPTQAQSSKDRVQTSNMSHSSKFCYINQIEFSQFLLHNGKGGLYNECLYLGCIFLSFNFLKEKVNAFLRALIVVFLHLFICVDFCCLGPLEHGFHVDNVQKLLEVDHLHSALIINTKLKLNTFIKFRDVSLGLFFSVSSGCQSFESSSIPF